ncbi:MAG: hypothetical protein AAF664_07575, partial [Planctomycetota bacterium]
FGIFNEVDHVHSPHTPEEIFRAVAGFAAGVKSVDRDAIVLSPSIGGTPMDVDRADKFLLSLSPLFKRGLLDGLNLHSYHDYKPNKPHYSAIDDDATWSPTRNFLRAKRIAKLGSKTRLAAGEFNYRNWMGSDTEQAAGFMTAMWDQLMVTASESLPSPRVQLFSVPYNIPDARPGRQTTMAARFDWQPGGDYEFEPNAKGLILQEQVRLTKGMRFVRVDSHRSATAVLKGRGRTAWVWHNREAFSSLANKEVKLVGLPAETRRLRVVTAANTLAKKSNVMPIEPVDGSVRIPSELLPDNETVLIMVDAMDSSDDEAIEILNPANQDLIK